jgi:hypothetical protein
MSMRPESSRNGKAELNGKGLHPVLEPRRIAQPRVYSHRHPSLLPIVVLCLAAGLATTIFMQSSKQSEATQSVPEAEAFRWAVNRAMSAAELTQTAQSEEEWQQVSSWWQDAIELMQKVPASDSKHDIALTKITEYQNNLQYSQNRSQNASQSGAAEDLWGIGSRRAMVIKVQGQPKEVDRYDSMCKEVLHYGKSKVELSNGMVTRYEDFDHKFKAAAVDLPLPSVQNGNTWSLGSLKEDVFKIQGTPSRVEQSDFSGREVLDYGDSTVDLVAGRVVGYNNIKGNLRVHVAPILTGDAGRTSMWSLESDRENLLAVQGTPAQVISDSSACTETLYYGNSTVTLKNGFISGYDNLDGNLRVKTK